MPEKTATQPAATGAKTKLQDAIDTAKAKGLGVTPEAEKAAEAIAPAPTQVKEPTPPEQPPVPQDVRSVIDAPQPQELSLVQPAEIKNGQLILTPKHLELIKTQIAPTATPQELELFLMMAYRTRLDPLMRQLYFIKYGQGDRAKVSYVTSIDGYRIIAHRTGDFAGVDEPTYERDAKNALTHCSITVYKIVQGMKCGFSAKVKLSEYNTNQNQWAKMPETMIAKVAEAHALRKAFPNDLSGIYTQDEMDQADARNQAPKAPVMASENQRKMIMAVLKEKGKNIDDLRDFLKRAFNIDSGKQMTMAMAKKTIDQLMKLPDVKPIDDVPAEEPAPDIEPESTFEEFVEGEYANADQIAQDAFDALG